MERSGGYGSSLAHSFSLPSLVEGSEPISEAEEFVEVIIVFSFFFFLYFISTFVQSYLSNAAKQYIVICNTN